jgi:hypothetical protein
MTIASQLATALSFSASQSGGTLTYKGVAALVTVGNVERMPDFGDDGETDVKRVEVSGKVGSWTNGDPEQNRTVILTSAVLGLIDHPFAVEDTDIAHGMLVMRLKRVSGVS